MTALLVALALFQSGSVGMTTIERGPISGIERPGEQVVRTPAEWQGLWTRHESGKPLPSVNFSEEMVVAVTIGPRPSSGWGVEIVGAEREGDGLIVRYRVDAPSPGTVAAAIVTTPFHFVRLPSVDGKVRFEKQTADDRR